MRPQEQQQHWLAVGATRPLAEERLGVGFRGVGFGRVHGWKVRRSS